MNYIKLFENFGYAKIEEIYIGDEKLSDLIKQYKLKPYEVDIINQIFDRIPYYTSNKQNFRNFIDKTINTEDTAEYCDSIDDVNCMDFNHYCDYNKRNYDNIIPVIKYYTDENPSHAGMTVRNKKTKELESKQGNLLYLLDYISNKLENASSDKMIYAQHEKI